MNQPQNKQKQRTSLCLIIFGTGLFLFFPTGGFTYLLYNYEPVKLYELILHINQIPGGDWILLPSNIYWEGNQLNYNFYNFLIFNIIPSAIFMATCLSATKFLGISSHEIGLTWSLGKQGNFSALILGILSGLFVVIIFIVFGPTLLAKRLDVHLELTGFDLRKMSPIAIFPGPIIEEFFFRGLFLAVLEKHYSTRVVLPSSALFFGMVHIIGAPLYMAFLTSLMGLYFGWLYVKTRSLILPILAHTIANIVAACVVVRS